MFMDVLTIKDLEELINKDNGVFISIYLPTYSSGVDIRQNPVRFKQLLREAEAKLYDKEWSKQEVESFLESATNLISDTKFWQNQSDGLAVFIYNEGIRYFRLPYEFKESIVVSDKLHVKPLLPLFKGNGQFNILALSKNDVRLFRCTKNSVKEVELEDAPDSVDDMQVDYDPNNPDIRRLSNPQVTSALSYNTVTQAQGNENDFERNELTRYFRAIDESLMKMHSEEPIPLVLAGVEYLIPIYREKSNYPNIVDDFIRGNPELIDGNQLHAKAWEIIEPLFLKDQELAYEKYQQFSGQNNKLYLDKLEKILPAAFNGQVESLIVDNDKTKWGKFNQDNFTVELHDEEKIGDEDLMEYASLLTLSRGGKVFAVDSQLVPDKKEMTAVLRY